MTISHSTSIHLTDPEAAAEVSLVDHTDHCDPFVSLKIGSFSLFLADSAVIDAIETALTEARSLLRKIDQ